MDLKIESQNYVLPIKNTHQILSNQIFRMTDVKKFQNGIFFNSTKNVYSHISYVMRM